MTPSAVAPLHGITVVTAEQAVSLPYCSFLLAEMGARVIKLEHPTSGDVIRGWDGVVRGLSSGYVWLNANKQNVALDLKNPAAGPVLERLLGIADVVLENFAPGVAMRLGLDAASVRARHPSIVHCSLSGYGQDGPYRDVKAYDLLIQGESGMLLTNGSPEEPAKIGLPITDLIAGSTAALAIAGALLSRKETQQGASLDIAMLDAALPWLSYFPHHSWHQGTEPPRTGMRHQYIVPYGPFLAADGVHVNMVVANASDWERFCRDVIERPDLLTDARSSTLAARTEHREHVESQIEAVVAALPSRTWFERLSRAGLSHGRVRSIAEVLQHPQVAERRMIVEATSPVGPVPLIRSPLGDPDTPRHVPALGEHTDVILAELGLDATARGTLRTSGATATG